MSKKISDQEKTEEIHLEELLEQGFEDDHLEADEELSAQKTASKKKSPKKTSKKKKAAKKKLKTTEKKQRQASEDLDSPIEALEETPSTQEQFSIPSAQPSLPNALETSFSSTAMAHSMESMVKHWTQVKKLTAEIETHLNNSSMSMKNVHFGPSHQEHETQVMMSKHTPLSQKISLGLSSLAFILAVVSFSFSQNVRNSVIAAKIPSPEVIAKSKQSISSTQVEKQAPEVAISKPTVSKVRSNMKRKRNRRYKRK